MAKVLLVFLISIFLTANAYGMGKKPQQQAQPVAPQSPASQEVEIITPERPSRPEVDMSTQMPSTVEPMPQELAVSQAPESESVSRIRDVQAALKNAGFEPGSIDGVMGRKTKRAVREFQSTNGLKVDGKVGPKTWAALQKYLSAAPSDTGTQQ